MCDYERKFVKKETKENNRKKKRKPKKKKKKKKKKNDKECVELERRNQLKKQMENYTNLNDCKWSKILLELYSEN